MTASERTERLDDGDRTAYSIASETVLIARTPWVNPMRTGAG
jgi:hypothetical protein